MMYNPKITPLTINVGPAATYEQPGCQSNQPLRVAPQVSQQHLIERRNNCNKSCLVTLILFICKFRVHSRSTLGQNSTIYPEIPLILNVNFVKNEMLEM